MLGACTRQLADTDSLTPAPGKGLLVLGFSYVGPVGDPSNPRSCPVYTILGANALQVHMGREGLRTVGQIQVSNIACARITPDSPVAYNFLHLDPGTYEMESIHYSIPFRGALYLREYPRVTIAASESVYVGDIVIDAIPPRAFKTANTLERARAAVAARGGPAEALVLRPFQLAQPATAQ